MVLEWGKTGTGENEKRVNAWQPAHQALQYSKYQAVSFFLAAGSVRIEPERLNNGEIKGTSLGVVLLLLGIHLSEAVLSPIICEEERARGFNGRWMKISF